MLTEAEWEKMHTELYFMAELHLPFKKIMKGTYKSIFVRSNKMHLLNQWDEYIETTKHFAKNRNTWLACKATQLLSSTFAMFQPLGFIPTQRQLHDDEVADIRLHLILNTVCNKYNDYRSLINNQVMMSICREEERLSKIPGTTALIKKLTDTRLAIKKMFEPLHQSIVDAKNDITQVSKIEFQAKRDEISVKMSSIISSMLVDKDCIKRQPWQWFFLKNKTQKLFQNCLDLINRFIPRYYKVKKQNHGINIIQNGQYNNKEPRSLFSTSDTKKSFSFGLLSCLQRQDNHLKLNEMAGMDIHQYYTIYCTTSGFGMQARSPKLNDNVIKQGLKCGNQ